MFAFKYLRKNGDGSYISDAGYEAYPHVWFTMRWESVDTCSLEEIEANKGEITPDGGPMFCCWSSMPSMELLEPDVVLCVVEVNNEDVVDEYQYNDNDCLAPVPDELVVPRMRVLCEVPIVEPMSIPKAWEC